MPVPVEPARVATDELVVALNALPPQLTGRPSRLTAADVAAIVVRLAREIGADQVDLTSAPEREAANRLYQRLGFERRETNVYRLPLVP